jgi:lysine 2,3-aminomutase
MKQDTINKQYTLLKERENLLAIKVGKFYQNKIDEELKTLGHQDGPLHRSVYPSIEKITLQAPGELKDFVEDRKNMPQLDSTMIRKYQNRMLFLPTLRCVSHCQYCFRQDVLAEPHQDNQIFSSKLDTVIKYLQKHTEITEVILSGGDPMILPFKRLQETLIRLRTETRIESIRIHTRAIVFEPKIFNEEKSNLLGEFGVRMVFHVTHPYEICDTVSQYIELLQKKGVKCYNQFPILRKINDHADVLIELLKKLDELNVRNLSMFIPDPIKYSAAFRMPLKRLCDLLDEFNWKSPSWINSTRVVLDSVYGKVRREDIKEYDEENGLVIFEREGKKIIYPDFPKDLDEPGNVQVMLWKRYKP